MIKTASVFLIVLFTCNHVLAQVSTNSVLPHVILYKTKKDYRKLVPVELSADRKQVLSYPAPQDLKTGGALALPVLLHKGYLLDKRGIGAHTAFTKYTYEEYSKLKELPSAGALMKKLADKNPMVVLYDCGARDSTNSTVKALNRLIDQNLLDVKCKRVVVTGRK